MRGRKEGTSHWVLEAPCEAFFNLRQLRKILINCAMYQVKEFLRIKRCSTCQAYGHTANSKEYQSSPLHSVDAVNSDTTPETAEMMNFTALTVPKALTTTSGTET
ncbi:hypothetical protein AVEN_168038-1 [Araneus ventricosus]|uniref:Uncharacterized protein n=1 Tax=Araneus ventricosus TaxID=182803 RepID=A0A4Y2JV80_ARAVE|nr:hypothetical protein AVEN_168038-1 [Araneus ventricosus]